MNRFVPAAWAIMIWSSGTLAQVPWPDAPKDIPVESVCLAQNNYWEARSESDHAQRAVAHVVLNHVAHPDFPETVCHVIRDGGPNGAYQFSWYCDGLSDAPDNAKAWTLAIELAHEVLTGNNNDPTGGVLFYHHISVDPGCSDEFFESRYLGEHIFYVRRRDQSLNQ